MPKRRCTKWNNAQQNVGIVCLILIYPYQNWGQSFSQKWRRQYPRRVKFSAKKTESKQHQIENSLFLLLKRLFEIMITHFFTKRPRFFFLSHVCIEASSPVPKEPGSPLCQTLFYTHRSRVNVVLSAHVRVAESAAGRTSKIFEFQTLIF